MSKVSKKGKKLVQLWLDEGKWDQIRAAADTVQEPITAWIRRAVFSALRKWQIPQATKLFDICSICGKRHDSQEHFGNK